MKEIQKGVYKLSHELKSAAGGGAGGGAGGASGDGGGGGGVRIGTKTLSHPPLYRGDLIIMTLTLISMI